jgi:Fur family transcriptional regulator, ferric uptake regulator
MFGICNFVAICYIFAMISSRSRMVETLQSSGFSITMARSVVFDVLEHNEPLTMSELCHKTKGVVDRASVYRTIDLFEKLAVVQRITYGWKYKLELSNEFQEHHHHLLCLKCGKLLAFHEHDKLEQEIMAIARNHEFNLTGHQIELQGLCADCQK